MGSGHRINVYFDELSFAVLEQLTTVLGVKQSALIKQLIIEKGIEAKIITLEEIRDSLYTDTKLEYQFSQQQTKFEGMLSSTRREIAEYSSRTEKDIRSLQSALSDLERLSYQTRDMLNSMLKYSLEESENHFRSADINMRSDYDPHLCAVKSEENFNRLQERLAVEKANNARRSKHL